MPITAFERNPTLFSPSDITFINKLRSDDLINKALNINSRYSGLVGQLKFYREKRENLWDVLPIEHLRNGFSIDVNSQEYLEKMHSIVPVEGAATSLIIAVGELKSILEDFIKSMNEAIEDYFPGKNVARLAIGVGRDKQEVTTLTSKPYPPSIAP